jgi:hypothetical protein
MAKSATGPSFAPPVSDLRMEPGARLRPFAADGDGRHPDHFRDFFQAETTKESQRDDPGFPRIEIGQRSQRIVDRDHELKAQVPVP